MEVTFYGTYDWQMFIEALRLTEKSSAFSTLFRYLALILAILIIGGGLYVWFVEDMDQSQIGRLLCHFITASLLGYYYFGDMLARNRSIAELFLSGPERTMQGKANLEGITIGPREHKVTLAWNRFVSQSKKDGLFALRILDGSVAVFHQDFFATDMDWQRFRQLAIQRVIEPQ